MGFDGDTPFRAVCSKISHPRHNVQLWVSAFVPICRRRTRLWWWLSDDLFPWSECRSGVLSDLFKSEMPSTKRTPGIAPSLSPSGTLLSHLGSLSVKICLVFDVPLSLGYRSLQFCFCAPDHFPASLGMSPPESLFLSPWLPWSWLLLQCCHHSRQHPENAPPLQLLAKKNRVWLRSTSATRLQIPLLSSLQ